MILANAIKREMRRGGQVYFIYNRVDTIDRMRDHIESLVPEARIQTAHGQMPEELLEHVMMDFYEGDYDILLATSIVENGLDVANANTIIVYNADHFGLSQLYQMRGRVGRSHHMAFAYFVYQADKILTETAEKRLQAMKEFAELGAGFKIAMRDLEIRGAGNLLGAQQHGHIASVGFEMYCKLLEEAVERLQSGKAPEEAPPEPVIDLQTEAYIDGGFITDAMHKIEIYQRIAAIRSNEELRSLLDELIDRFGDPTKPVMHLLEVARIKNYARELGIRREEVVFAMDAVCDPVSLFEPIYSDGGDAVCVMDQVRDNKNTDEDWLEQIALKEAMARLSERERQILALRYSDGKTQMEVSSEIGISQAQVSRLEKGAIEAIKRNNRA